MIVIRADDLGYASESRAPLELYNLASDPAEKQDVTSAHPEIVSKMENILKTGQTRSEKWG